MINENYMPRIIDKKISEYLETFGAVCIEGPKWFGKTWSSSFHSNSDIFIGDPAGNFQNRRLAELSPDLVLEGKTPRLIDEWQEVPPIWDAVRNKVDQTTEKGLYILTGSSTPNHKGILHSGAGRIARLRMRPMSLFESGESSGTVSLEKLCRGELNETFTGDVALAKLIGLIIRGGWPGSIRLPPERASLIPADYLNAIINDDVYRMDGIKRNTAKMQLLLRSLARNESTLASNRTLKNDMREYENEDIDVETISDYLNIFERLYITDNLLPYSTGIRSKTRLTQSVKRRLADPSLACALMKATPGGLLGDLETLGFLFESLCERDLKIYSDSFGSSLYHFRDYAGREIDAVIELPDGQWCAFEIKLGANQVDSAAESLIKINNEIKKTSDGKPPNVLCVICGMSNAAYRRPDGVFVVPITALRN